MNTIIRAKFIKSEGYWYNIIKIDQDKYLIFNTRRKRQQHIRDGIGYYVPEIEFETVEEAKNYLDEMEKNG